MQKYCMILKGTQQRTFTKQTNTGLAPGPYMAKPLNEPCKNKNTPNQPIFTYPSITNTF